MVDATDSDLLSFVQYFNSQVSPSSTSYGTGAGACSSLFVDHFKLFKKFLKVNCSRLERLIDSSPREGQNKGRTKNKRTHKRKGNEATQKNCKRTFRLFLNVVGVFL